MRKRLWAAAAVTLGLAAGLASGQANAATLVLDASTNYGGIVTSLGGGLVSFGGSTYELGAAAGQAVLRLFRPGG